MLIYLMAILSNYLHINRNEINFKECLKQKRTKNIYILNICAENNTYNLHICEYVAHLGIAQYIHIIKFSVLAINGKYTLCVCYTALQ